MLVEWILASSVSQMPGALKNFVVYSGILAGLISEYIVWFKHAIQA